MKLKELFESVDIVPAFFDAKNNSYHAPMKEVEGPCPLCDGSGQDFNDESQPCWECNGKKRSVRNEYIVPTLNMANGAAAIFFPALGVNLDWKGGSIKNKDLPQIKRRLIELKNRSSSRDQYTYEPYEEDRPKPQRYVDRSGDIPQIKTKGGGPRIFDSGMTDDRIMRYVDKMLEIVDYAQKNNCDVTWA